MTSYDYPWWSAPVGHFDEPTDDERRAFLAKVETHQLKLTAAHKAAERLSRAHDRAALYVRHSAPLPQAVQQEIESLTEAWEAARWSISFTERGTGDAD